MSLDVMYGQVKRQLKKKGEGNCHGWMEEEKNCGRQRKETREIQSAK